MFDDKVELSLVAGLSKPLIGQGGAELVDSIVRPEGLSDENLFAYYVVLAIAWLGTGLFLLYVLRHVPGFALLYRITLALLGFPIRLGLRIFGDRG